MTEIEKIFRDHATFKLNTFAGTQKCMNYFQFTQALAEVFEMVKVTDEEILNNSVDLDEAVGAYKIRSLSQSKIEKLLSK
jgi:hypothetical protein